MEIDSDRVQSRFARGAATYDRHARIQRAMAERLAARLVETTGRTHFPVVLELGCGTGLLTAELLKRLQIDRWIGNDLSGPLPELEAMFDATAPETRPSRAFLPGDMRSIELPAPVDLVVSNAALQWLDRPEPLLCRLEEHLPPGGVLAFSTFGPGNLPELTELLGVGLRYPSLEEYRDILEDGWRLLCAEEESAALFFPTALDVVKHFKLTGTNLPTRRFWTPRRLRAFVAEYEQRFGTPEGVRLTFHPMYFVAVRG